MLSCFTQEVKNGVQITPVTVDSLGPWLQDQTSLVQQWVQANQFTAKADTICLLPDQYGRIAEVIFGVESAEHFWSFGVLPSQLPPGAYYLAIDHEFFNTPAQWERAVLAWGLGSFRANGNSFPSKQSQLCPQLILPADSPRVSAIVEWVETIYWVRHLINRPANEMAPQDLFTAAQRLQHEYGATLNCIEGEALRANHFPAIYTVGSASSRSPCLIDMSWGPADAPRVTLVGKGVCFDTGGLNLKTAAGMRLMKKDMGGAAHVLGLARMVMQQQLPLRLRVLIPAVDNAVSGYSYRPGDVVTTRAGKRIEIGNTDAEGRLILADALTAAGEDQPNLLIDMATLTGAARVALGAEIPVFFCNHDGLAQSLMQVSKELQDPLWQLPLYQPYKRYLKSDIADCSNISTSEYGGAITAALFLQQFIDPNVPWVHFDIMAWNDQAQPGRPMGGEAMALRALLAYLQQYSLSPKV